MAASESNPNERYDNPETAQDLRGELIRREEQKRQETAKSLSVKERIQKRRAEDYIEQEFFGEMLRFNRPGLKHRKRAVAFADQHEGDDEEDIAAEELEEIVDFMVETFADLAIDDDPEQPYDEDFWEQFDFVELEPLMENVIMSGVETDEIEADVDAEEVREFRGK